jgi:hypothetical protein
MPPTLIANAPDHQVAGDVLSAAVDAHRVSRTLVSCEGKKSENKKRDHQRDASSRSCGRESTRDEPEEPSATRTDDTKPSNDSAVEKSGRAARERAVSERTGGCATTLHKTESPNANINVLETSTAPLPQEGRTAPSVTVSRELPSAEPTKPLGVSGHMECASPCHYSTCRWHHRRIDFQTANTPQGPEIPTTHITVTKAPSVPSVVPRLAFGVPGDLGTTERRGTFTTSAGTIANTNIPESTDTGKHCDHDECTALNVTQASSMPSVELRKLSGVTGLGAECVSTLHAQVCTQSSPKLRRLARPSRSPTGLYIELPKTKGAYTLASGNPCGSGARAAVGLRRSASTGGLLDKTPPITPSRGTLACTLADDETANEESSMRPLTLAVTRASRETLTLLDNPRQLDHGLADEAPRIAVHGRPTSPSSEVRLNSTESGGTKACTVKIGLTHGSPHYSVRLGDQRQRGHTPGAAPLPMRQNRGRPVGSALFGVATSLR